MATYANRTCKECGLKRPQYDMRQVEKTVKSGHSGISFSVSLQPTVKSTRINSGRNYYRKQVAWECASSAAHHDPGYFRRKEIEDKKKKEQEVVRKAEKARLDAIKKQQEHLDQQEKLRLQRVNVAIKSQAVVALREIFSNECLIDQIKDTSEYMSIGNQYRERLTVAQNIETLGFDGFFKQVVASIQNPEKLLANKIRARRVAIRIIRKSENNILREAKIRLSNRLLGLTKAFGWITSFWLVIWLLSVIEGSTEVTAIFPFASFLGLIYFVLRLSTRKARNLINELSQFVQKCFDLYRNHALLDARDSVLHSDIVTEPDAPALIGNFFSHSQAPTNSSSFSESQIAAEKIFFARSSTSTDPKLETVTENTDQTVSSQDQARVLQGNGSEITHKEPAASELAYKELASTIFYSDNFFDLACFILMCHVAHVDHDFGEQEKRFVAQAVRLSDGEFSLAESFIAKKSHIDLLLKMLLKKYPNGDAALVEIINNLFFVAESDGLLTSEEIAEISNIAEALEISKEDFDEILRESLNRHEENQVVRQPCFVEEIFDEFDLEDIR